MCKELNDRELRQLYSERNSKDTEPTSHASEEGFFANREQFCSLKPKLPRRPRKPNKVYTEEF